MKGMISMKIQTVIDRLIGILRFGHSLFLYIKIELWDAIWFKMGKISFFGFLKTIIELSFKMKKGIIDCISY